VTSAMVWQPPRLAASSAVTAEEASSLRKLGLGRWGTATLAGSTREQ
jgi:hypothetical protein